MLARAGPSLYLLAFRSGNAAQKFVRDAEVDHGEPRLVMKRRAPEIMAHLMRSRVSGILVDYDAQRNTYQSAGRVY